MRLFASLDLPDRICESIEPLLPVPESAVRSVPRCRWHVTLAFYGEVSEPGCQCLRRRLAERLARSRGDAPMLQVDGGGAFGGGAVYLRVVGAAGPDQERLAELARCCTRVGLRCQAPGVTARQAFHGHLTVARKRGRGPLAAQYLQALEGIRSPVWQPRHVDLVESVLAKGPRYEVLDRFPLAANSDAGG